MTPGTQASRDIRILANASRVLADWMEHFRDDPSPGRWRSIVILGREIRSRIEALEANPDRRLPVPIGSVETGFCATCRRTTPWIGDVCTACEKKEGGAS